MTNITSALIFYCVLFSGIAFAETGHWRQSDSFAQINAACIRKYKCVPSEDIIYSTNKELICSKPATVFGVCSSGGGSIDSCNFCLTSIPEQLCECHLTPK